MLNLTLYPNRKYSGPFLNTSVSLLLLLAMNHLMYVHVQVHTQLLTGNFTFYTLAYIFMTYLQIHMYTWLIFRSGMSQRSIKICVGLRTFNSIQFYFIMFS